MRCTISSETITTVNYCGVRSEYENEEKVIAQESLTWEDVSSTRSDTTTQTVIQLLKL